MKSIYFNYEKFLKKSFRWNPFNFFLLFRRRIFEMIFFTFELHWWMSLRMVCLGRPVRKKVIITHLTIFNLMHKF